MNLKTIQKLLKFAKPYPGNPEYWSWVPGFNIIFNHKVLSSQGWVCGDVLQIDSEVMGESMEQAVCNYIKKRSKT